jgi:hypothetical protein
MSYFIRGVAALVGGVAAGFFVLGGTLLIPLNLPRWIIWAGSLAVVILVARYVWVGPASSSAAAAHARYVILGGLVIGGIGFAAGFIGPMIFAPDANLGPMLGIFITGPLGFVLGIVAGHVYSQMRARRSRVRPSRVE